MLLLLGMHSLFVIIHYFLIRINELQKISCSAQPYAAGLILEATAKIEVASIVDSRSLKQQGSCRNRRSELQPMSNPNLIRWDFYCDFAQVHQRTISPLHGHICV